MGGYLGYLGIGKLASSKPTEYRSVVEPAWTMVGVRTPGGRHRRHKLSVSPLWLPPLLKDVGRLHFYEPRVGEKELGLRLVTPQPGMEVMLRIPGASPRSLGRTPLRLPGRVRRSVPGVGHYDRAGEPLFASNHALQLTAIAGRDSRPRWFKDTLKLELTLRSAAGIGAPVTLSLDAVRAWEGPAVVAELTRQGGGGVTARLKYGPPEAALPAQSPAPVVAPTPAPAPAPSGSTRRMLPGYRDNAGNCVCPPPPACPAPEAKASGRRRARP
jgi:hypothetical protein